MSNIFVGRQPIFDTRLNVYGYELLYRSGDKTNTSSGMASPEQATTTTIINTFVEIGLENLVRDKFAAINMTEEFMLTENKIPFSPSQVILEILEDIPVTPELIQATQRLVDAGYIVALDDYIYNPDHAPLIELVSIVKLDLMALSGEELQQNVSELRKYDVKLLAEKLETADDFIRCRDLGFDYFQGYFLSKPQIIKGKSLPANRFTVLNLLAVLHNPDSSHEELAEAINTDVTTSYKLLKLINSAAFNLQREIESIEQGVLLLGRRNLCSWTSMLAMSTLSDRPSEILRTAMTRAKMCELLAVTSGERSTDRYFTVGMFSALDLLLQRPLEQLLEPLPLSDDIKSALLKHDGKIGETLVCVMAYEISDWDNTKLSYLDSNDIFLANIEAVTWANGIMNAL